MAQTNKSRIEAAIKRLRKYNQEHVLQFIDEISPEQKLLLLADVEALDMDMIQELIDQYVVNEPVMELPHEIVPPEVYPAIPTSELKDRYCKARELGERLIAEHKVAAFTVAGGMGTRLNFNGPKGNVPATPVRSKTLFQVFAEGILANQRRYNSIIPWYIMTSPANHDDTVAAFKNNGYFGLDPDNVKLFPQGMMPCFSMDGKILLAEKYEIAKSPDGHGGSLRALYNSGSLEDMARRGVEYISYFQIDNPLVYVVDPLFIGLHALDNAEMSSKAVIKCDPLEKVGNFAIVDGRMTVIEYSDLPDELAYKKLDNGRLAFEFGSIAIHVISRDFVNRINSRGFSLPWHRAIKKVPYIDSSGNLVKPEKTNAIKLETFVFDGLPLAEGSIVFEIDRDEQFGPIKNAQGVDSIESSQRLQIARAARWLQEAGVAIPRNQAGEPDLMIEISPCFALDPHELTHKKSQLRPLKSGDIVYLG